MSSHSAWNVVEFIRQKRDGVSLHPTEIEAFVRAYTTNQIPDYQAAAWLMAVFWRGLSTEELVALTKAMLHSGQVIDLSEIRGAKIDKHSTGGVGDKISLPLAPAVAACGVFVPMMSGRGLGHTGGTLDKLESIPGFSSQLAVAKFKQILKSTGLSLIGQTEDLAPADKKLYALRDVTGTVESIPLISASIMSKKLAEGIDGLVLDVKVGSGAFMKTLPEARTLAQTLQSIGKGAGKQVSAFITDMNQPLGRWIGNAAEVNESIEILRGRGPADVRELTCVLGGEMLRLAGVVKDDKEGQARIAEVLDNGKALKAFSSCAKEQGATIDVADAAEAWLASNVHKETHAILAKETGYVTKIETESLGVAGVQMGIGRSRKEDAIDPAAYLYADRKLGEFVQAGQPLCHFAVSPALSPARFQAAVDLLEKAYSIESTPVSQPPLILEIIR